MFFSVLPPECCSLTMQVTSKNPEERRVKASPFLQHFLRAALQGRYLHLLASSSTKHHTPEVCSTYKYPRLRWATDVGSRKRKQNNKGVAYKAVKKKRGGGLSLKKWCKLQLF